MEGVEERLPFDEVLGDMDDGDGDETATVLGIWTGCSILELLLLLFRKSALVSGEEELPDDNRELCEVLRRREGVESTFVPDASMPLDDVRKFVELEREPEEEFLGNDGACVCVCVCVCKVGVGFNFSITAGSFNSVFARLSHCR